MTFQEFHDLYKSRLETEAQETSVQYDQYQTVALLVGITWVETDGVTLGMTGKTINT